jgi:hypothetical protein
MDYYAENGEDENEGDGSGSGTRSYWGGGSSGNSGDDSNGCIAS